MASSVKGFKELQARLANASKAFEQEVKEIVEVNTGFLEKQAHDEAPGPNDRIQTQYGSENESDIVNGREWTPISQAITYDVSENGFKGRVIVNDSAGDIAAWVEFGTGQAANSYLLTVPLEWADKAREYYISGNGTILDRPYLLPAFEKYSLEMIKDLKKALKDIKL